VSRRRKVALDTHLFIEAFRDDDARAALNRFHAHWAPFEYLSVIVAQELRAGTRSDVDLAALEKNILTRYERAGRAFAPSELAWHRSGDVLAQMAQAEGLQLARLSKSFANDVLLALSCRESGCVLITRNERNFQRIQRYVPFQFVRPWDGIVS
jgi:predicted nucleic acid-binding protein